MEKPPMFLPAALRRIMLVEGIDRLAEIARRTGIHASQLSRFMSGERGLSHESLERLARAFPAHKQKIMKHSR
jgi:transcriptional regulator with XRE-family HTH domain